MKAPGYNSYRWIQQDWRSLRVTKGKIDYAPKCGAKGTKFKSGKPRLCLPLYVIKKLMKSKSDREILKTQINKKARAKKGQRVTYHPRIAELHKKMEYKDKTKDKKGSKNTIYKEKYKKWMTLSDVIASVPAMKKKKVSEVARGVKKSTRTKEGFVQAYKATKGSIPKMRTRKTGQGDQTWSKRRDEFIARHLKQMRQNDTHKTGWLPSGEPTRRHLGLIAWAYTPSQTRTKKWLAREKKVHKQK